MPDQNTYSLFGNQEAFYLESYSDEDFEYCSHCLEVFRLDSLKKNLIGKLYCLDCYEVLPVCGSCHEPVEECDLGAQFCERCESIYDQDFEGEVEDEETY